MSSIEIMAMMAAVGMVMNCQRVSNLVLEVLKSTYSIIAIFIDVNKTKDYRSGKNNLYY